jgi:N-acyl homoserine lactone hydrolase
MQARATTPGSPTEVRRLFVLLGGFEIIPKTISTRDRGGRFIISVPITAYLLDTARGWVMFDCGLDETNLRDPERLRTLFLEPGWDPPPVVQPQHEIGRQLGEIGIGFGDIAEVVLSHLHADHSGHIKRMPQARFTIQRREHDYAFGGAARPSWFPSDYDAPGLRWNIVEGDAELMPGIGMIATHGHSPGHQSLVVDLPQTGRVVLAGDVGDLLENFENEILPGESQDDAAALASIRRINALVADGAMLFLTHDPVLVQQIRLAPQFYD